MTIAAIISATITCVNCGILIAQLHYARLGVDAASKNAALTEMTLNRTPVGTRQTLRG